MSSFLESYAKSNSYSHISTTNQKRKLKYPAIYKNLSNKFFAVSSVSYPATTETIADYLSKNAKYITVYHEKLKREILILSHEGSYFHEVEKDSNFLVVGVFLNDDMKKCVYEVEEFLGFENDKLKFVEI